MHLTQFKFLLLSLLGFSMVVGIFNISNTFAGANDPDIDYLNAQNLPIINLEAGESRAVTVLIKNTSLTTWSQEILKLGTVFHTEETDRPSAWADASWDSAIRIASTNTTNIKPLQVAEFNFRVTAPKRVGMYREYFRPVLEHSHWLQGEVIALNFRVSATDEIPAGVRPTETKEMIVDRATQQADIIQDGIVVATLSISSGIAGYTTPSGVYRVMNHAENAFSSKYNLWMPNWMALISPDGSFRGYGLHGLPYWRVKTTSFTEGTIYPGGRLYTQGKLYEGFENLGKPASHGCVRFGVEEIKIVYNWAEVGTKVTVI